MRTLTIVLGAAAVAVIAVTALADGAAAAGKSKGKTKSLSASRTQVERACANAGSTAFNTQGSSGAYGCASEGGWIYCESDGQCEGGRAERRAARGHSRGAPPARLSR